VLMMFVVKRKRSGRLRHLSTEKSLTGITALLALRKRRRGTMARFGASKSSSITEKGSNN